MWLWLYKVLALLIYAIINSIAVEIIFASIFTVETGNQIRITFGGLFGDTKYKKNICFYFCILSY